MTKFQGAGFNVEEKLDNIDKWLLATSWVIHLAYSKTFSQLFSRVAAT